MCQQPHSVSVSDQIKCYSNDCRCVVLWDRGPIYYCNLAFFCSLIAGSSSSSWSDWLISWLATAAWCWAAFLQMLNLINFLTKGLLFFFRILCSRQRCGLIRRLASKWMWELVSLLHFLIWSEKAFRPDSLTKTEVVCFLTGTGKIWWFFLCLMKLLNCMTPKKKGWMIKIKN